MLIVRPTPQRDVRDRRRATHSVRLQVMELHGRALVAAAPSLADEGASPVVP